MKYMLDTNICYFIIKHKTEKVLHKFMEQEPGDITVSSITYAELLQGIEKSEDIERNRIALHLFLSEIPVIPFDDSAAQEYGMLMADLQKKGAPIGLIDTLVAAQAKALDLTLVTNNTEEFAGVEGLLLEDWT